MTDSYGNMYLTVASLIKINNIITGSNNITLRKVNANPYCRDKVHMDKDLIEDKPWSTQWKEHYTCRVLFDSSTKNTSVLWWEW